MCNKISFILWCLVPGLAFAKSKAEQEFDPIKIAHLAKNGDLQVGLALKKLMASTNSSKFKKRDISLQIIGKILYGEQLPVLAASYAAKSVLAAKDPFDDSMKVSWAILFSTSKEVPIQYILENIANNVDLGKKEPYFFKSDWNYFVANSLLAKNKKDQALNHLKKLNVRDRHFLSAQYLMALIYHSRQDYKNAELALNTIVSRYSWGDAVEEEHKQKILDYTYLALGRIFYEQRKFVQATRSYRKVSRRGYIFYRSLFEQSWSLFMSGNPQHALGSLYGANSPFFSNYFNPESKILEAMIHYWLCRYDDSRSALTDFAEVYAKSVEQLGSFLDRQRLSSEGSYALFENLISGVSSRSLGIPRKVLITAAEQDAMLLLRDQYATVLDEKLSLETNELAETESVFNVLLKLLDDKSDQLQRAIGRQYLTELKGLKSEFDEMNEQSQFLYLELMMSEKEQLLGRELHADTKVTRINNLREISDWSSKAQTWAEGKHEYWWDEIGYHIVDVKPQCKL